MRNSAHLIFTLLVSFTAYAVAQPYAVAQQGTAPAQPQATAPTTAQPPALAPHPAPAPEEGVHRIRLDVLVTDKSGKAVPSLELQDFTLLDNGQPAKILSLHAIDTTVPNPEMPVQAILVFDLVNLNFQQLAVEREEADKFFRRNSGILAHPLSIYVFTEQGLSALPVSSVHGDALAEELKNVDAQLRVITHSQAYYGYLDRFNRSIQAFGNIVQNEAKKPGKKLLIWVGPGWPMFDSQRSFIDHKTQQQFFASIVELSTWLRQAQISVYSVAAGIPDRSARLHEGFLKGARTEEQVNPSMLALKVLAIQSGGRILGPDNDMASQLESCIHDADSFYTITFNPPRADHANELHDLKVVINKPGLQVLTNTGYYNQP